VVFRHSSFPLIKDYVGMALHLVLGGSPSGFYLACVKPCHFRFSVPSKKVGLLITSRKLVTMEHFDVGRRIEVLDVGHKEEEDG
jgi:hypothetical protein